MPESDWSQFIPDLINTIIGVFLAVFVPGIIAYFTIERFKTWINRLLEKIILGLKWLIKRWYFFLPLCVFLILATVIFYFFADWKIVVLAITFYLIGLLGWGLSDMYPTSRVKGRSTNHVKTKFFSIPLQAGIGNSYLKNRYIDPPVGDVVLGGVQFQLPCDSLIFDTNEQIRYYLPLDDGGKETGFKLSESVNGVKSVYF